MTESHRGYATNPKTRDKIWFLNLPKATEELDIYPSLDFIDPDLASHISAQNVLDAFHRVWTELDAAPSFDANVLMGCEILSAYELPRGYVIRTLAILLYRSEGLSGTAPCVSPSRCHRRTLNIMRRYFLRSIHCGS